MIALLIIGLLFAIVGLVGCILPIIPGPPVSFLALIIISYARDWEPFSRTFLIVAGCLTVLVTLSDYVIPASGARKYGASRFGVWGAIIGTFLGVFVFPPWGMIFGAIVGAFAGELIAGKEWKHALRAGWGVFVGNLLGMGIKLVFSGAILFLYIKEMF